MFSPRHCKSPSVRRAWPIVLLLILVPMIRDQPLAAQGIVGEAIGRLIQPAVGPIIERGIDEGFNEIIRRRPWPRPGGGGVIPLPSPAPRPTPYPGPGPLPSPQPVPWPQPQPVPSPQPVPYPQPGQGGSPSPGNGIPVTRIIPNDGQIIRSRIVTSVPSVSPPDNTLGDSVTTKRNASLIENALKHVLSEGPALAGVVIQNEVDGIRRSLATSLASGGSDEAATVLAGVAALSPQTPFDVRQQAIAAWKDRLSTINAGTTLSPQDLAIVSQRTKNISNMNLLTEMARVMGTQRQQDLFRTLDQAVIKSNAPSQLTQLLTGSTGRSDSRRLPQLTIPPGVPKLALANPASNDGDVRFVADGTEELSLPSGGLLATSKQFVLKFQTGMGVVKEYTLKEGFFQFSRGETGWDVKQKTNVRFILSAEHSSLPFHYTLNGQMLTLPAGQSVEHLSGAVQRIDFDRGLPDRSVSTRIAMPGRYLVGVDPETGAWDLHKKARPVDGDDPTTIARRRWAESIDAAMNVGNGESGGVVANGVVGSLLDAIE